MMEIMIRDSFYQEMVHNKMNDGKCDEIFYLSREGSSKGFSVLYYSLGPTTALRGHI